MKIALTALALPLAWLSPALAGAQELGSKGEGVLSADRLMGISSHRISGQLGNNRYSNDWTSISFGWRTPPDSSPFDIPRLAFDYLVIDHLSIGGALGYVSHDGDANDGSAFLLAPRIGYAYAFGRVVGIWPRGGFTYHSTSIDGVYDERGFALTLECPFTFSPAQHFALHVGPTLDVDLFGDRDPSPITQGDRKYRTFGVNAGLLGWF